MARHPEDQKTGDLLTAEIAPVPVKRGRPCKGNRPMTAAERKRASRARLVAKSHQTTVRLELAELRLLKLGLQQLKQATPARNELLKKLNQAEHKLQSRDLGRVSDVASQGGALPRRGGLPD